MSILILLRDVFLTMVLYVMLWLFISTVWMDLTQDHISWDEFLIIQVLVVLSLAMIYLGIRYDRRYRQNHKLGVFQTIGYRIRKFFAKIWEIAEKSSVRESNDLIKLPGYGRVRPCCYNSARLSDQYCLCGRVIPPQLLEFVNQT